MTTKYKPYCITLTDQEIELIRTTMPRGLSERCSVEDLAVAQSILNKISVKSRR